MTDAITREEKLLAGIAIEPITREEMFLAKLAGQDIHTPEPITRKERLYQKIIENSGGSSGGEGESHPLDEFIEGTTTEITSNAKAVSNNMFYKPSMTTANFPLATSIGKNAFNGCTNLTTANFPLATSIGSYTFNGCTNLTTVNFPLVTSIESYAFQSCGALSEVNFPEATSVTGSVFNNCESLTSARIPKNRGWLFETFRLCSALKIADCGFSSKIYTGAFLNCKELTTIILRNEELVTLSETGAFAGTPFASGGTGGTVYVPQALIEEYKIATNWSTLYTAGTCNFVAIEGSEYDV